MKEIEILEQWLKDKNKLTLPHCIPKTITIDEVLDYIRKLKNNES